MKKRFVILWSVLAGVFALLLIALCIGSGFADYYASQLNSFFNIIPYERIEDEFAEAGDTQYYKPKFSRLASDSEKEEAEENGQPAFTYIADKEALYEYDKEVAREAAANGAVLLWNNDKALPLTNKTETVNFYGGRSVNWLYVTDGSGGTRMSEHPTVRAAFEAQGYTVNDALWTWYQSHSYGTGTGTISETTWDSAIESNTVPGRRYLCNIAQRLGRSRSCDDGYGRRERQSDCAVVKRTRSSRQPRRDERSGQAE